MKPGQLLFPGTVSAPRRARAAALALLWPVAVVAATLIRDATLVDGTGAPRREGSVRVAAGRIIEMGELRPEPGEEVVSGHGLVLAPGFIDAHSHVDELILEQPDALAAVSQGITTAIVGQDGESPYPLADFFARLRTQPPAINLAAFAGHGTLRRRVLGREIRRQCREAELAAMSLLLEQELRAGALGLSTGLEYNPGIYSDTAELVALARVAARAGGRYVSHIRSEDRRFWEALQEALEIGRKAKVPVQISHLKLGMCSLWGQSARLLKKLEAARAGGVNVTADVYPYTYWQSTLTVLFPNRDFTNRAAAELALREVAPGAGLVLGQFDAEPGLVGMSIAEIARQRQRDEATTLIELVEESLARQQRTGKAGECVIGHSMSEPDVEALLVWPHATVCTDGGLVMAHPRHRGAFPRVLRRYVRERPVLSLEEAVRKMTWLAAQQAGLTNRGRLQAGWPADLVLFDPATVADQATIQEPHRLSTGIVRVWVNGEIVFADGRSTGRRPGQPLTR